MILAKPLDIPVTIPVEDPTVATAGLLLVHVPLPEQNKAAVCPMHIEDGPEILEGFGFTVTGCTE